MLKTEQPSSSLKSVFLQMLFFETIELSFLLRHFKTIGGSFLYNSGYFHRHYMF